ncbi:MAG: dihydrofolate reductase [Bacteroidales bacterium]|nr:dihydrofolate reductase [Candidatus Colicola equi]
MLSIIVAISENNAIGQKGGLLCHLPADLKHFKEITSGHPVLMGERTYLSLPKRPLPNRRNIVLTDNPQFAAEGVEIVHSIPEALQLINEDSTAEFFIIGGGMVYRQFFALADKLYITRIHHTWNDADTFFPEIKDNEWQVIKQEDCASDNKNLYNYTFLEYIKK